MEQQILPLRFAPVGMTIRRGEAKQIWEPWSICPEAAIRWGMLLAEAMPEFSRELIELLISARYPVLAAQVDRLEIVAKCDCNDGFCATFYTARKPFSRYGQERRTIEVWPTEGMILLDVIGETIIKVEVLYRDDVRSKLIPLFT